jgi:hypothetical protein
MPDALRTAVEQSAARTGNSLNSEIVERLERSFAREEQDGGREMQQLTRLWQSAFLRGLLLGGRVRELPEGDYDAALRDPFAFRTAFHSANDAVLASRPTTEFKPDRSPEEITKFFEMLDVFARLTARGAIITSKDVEA